MTIYADVLVALNILITYILVVAVRVFCKIPTNKWAVMLGSLVGGFSSLIIFWENMGIALSIAFKLASAGVIVAISFLPESIRIFLKTYSGFFLVSFLFGGAVYGLQITLKPQNILYYNGIVYFDMSISYLVGCVLSVYGVFLMADYLITKNTYKGGKCQITITYNNKSVSMVGFVDTGNTLTDGMSGKPVIVAELSAVTPLFSREELLFFKKDDLSSVPESLSKAIRLIPCKALTGETLLRAFVPACVKIETNKKIYTTSFCTVAVTGNELSQGEYRALLNNTIFENVKEEKSNDKINI